MKLMELLFLLILFYKTQKKKEKMTSSSLVKDSIEPEINRKSSHTTELLFLTFHTFGNKFSR